jgi:stage II sporulation protein D
MPAKTFGRSLSAVLLTVFCITVGASASENIRVAVADDQRTIVLRSSSGLTVEGVRSGHAGKKIVFGAGYAGNKPVRVRSDDGFVQVNGRSYRGSVEVRRKKNGRLLAVNDLNIEDYLLGVVAEEMPFDWEPEALKTQAVVARTFAIYQKRNAGRRPYHILATVNGQVYSGRRGERPEAARAVQETRGLVLVHAGEVIPAFFHSSCGGHTEDASELWGIDAPYLKGVDCDCQRISKYGVWERRIGLSSILSALRKRGYRLNTICDLKTGSITRAGRVREVEIIHGGGKEVVPAEILRQTVGYEDIPSVFFETSVSGREVIFSGRGRGHGVGLCQWGAKTLAREGHDHHFILNHYYPGTRLVKAGNLTRAGENGIRKPFSPVCSVF